MENQKKQPQLSPQRLAGESDVVIKEAMSLENVREALNEDQGYDAPFATFTWRYWMDAQARTMQCFSRFVRAVEEHHLDHAIMIGLEMQEMATAMLLEAYAQSANTPLEELPPDQLRHVNS